MTEENLATLIITESIYIHQTMGPGLLENVYKNCLSHRLTQRRLFVEVEKPIPVYFESVRMECGYRADIIVENLLVVETKSIAAISDIEIAQVLTYLKFQELHLGLILNFNVTTMKNGIRRVVRGYHPRC